MDFDLTELAKTRVIADVRSLKKLIKDFYRLVTPSLVGEELEAAHTTFLMGLDQLALQFTKTYTLEKVTELEVRGYEEGSLEIEGNQRETERKIELLRTRLNEAQRDRARALEYDALAKDIGKYPTREKGIESKDKLNTDIQLLLEEQRTYAATWDSRKTVFDGIVERLVIMSDTVRDEKAEQERRRALDDGDEAEETVVPPITSATTPPSALPGVGTDGQTLNPDAAPFLPNAGAEKGVEGGMEVDGEEEVGGIPEVAMEGIEIDVGREEKMGEVGEILEEGERGEEKEEGEA